MPTLHTQLTIRFRFDGFKVIDKLAAHGYQGHADNLLLHLNFNRHYSAPEQ